MRQLLKYQIAVLIALCGVAALPAEDLRLNANAGHQFGHHAGPCGTCCPRCHAYCQLTVTPDKEEKTCWEIECEEICIPAIRFPWEKCCEPKCGTVISVRRLKKVTYECPTCKYEWTPVCASCGSCCGGAGAPQGAPPIAPPPPGELGPPVPPPVNGAAPPAPLARPMGIRQ